jgi:hypothetical protein
MSLFTAFTAGFELSKNKRGVDICLFIVIVITHRRFSIINNGGGLKLTPQGIPGHLVWGVKQTTGGSTPPTPPAIQTLLHSLTLENRTA